MKGLEFDLRWGNIYIILVSLLVSLFLFYHFFSYLNSLRNINEVSKEEEKEVDIDTDIMLYNELFSQCLIEYNYSLDINCDQKIPESIKQEQIDKGNGTNFINAIGTVINSVSTPKSLVKL